MSLTQFTETIVYMIILNRNHIIILPVPPSPCSVRVGYVVGVHHHGHVDCRRLHLAVSLQQGPGLRHHHVCRPLSRNHVRRRAPPPDTRGEVIGLLPVGQL